MWITALLLAAAIVAKPADPARVPLSKVINTEKLISTQFAAMYPDELWFLIGTTRGVYLSGLGVVFSAEINLATGPSLSPFKQTITKEEIARHRDKKEVRLPILRNRMYSIVASMSSYLEMMPDNEEFVLAVTLLRYPWEEAGGMPSQIVMRVPRGKLMDAQRQNARPDSVIKVQEY
jgi:hypothetical protein